MRTPKSIHLSEQHKRALLNALIDRYQILLRGDDSLELEALRTREVYRWIDGLDGPITVAEET